MPVGGIKPPAAGHQASSIPIRARPRPQCSASPGPREGCADYPPRSGLGVSHPTERRITYSVKEWRTLGQSQFPILIIIGTIGTNGTNGTNLKIFFHPSLINLFQALDGVAVPHLCRHLPPGDVADSMEGDHRLSHPVCVRDAFHRLLDGFF